MRVFNFGSINIDHVYRVERFVQPGETLASQSLETVLGGKGANQSVALARAGIDVSHLGRVGLADKWAVDALSDFGVNVDAVELKNAASGHAIIQVDAQGENAIVLHGGTNQGFDAESVKSMLKNAKAGDWLLLQNECNALDHAFDVAQQMRLNIAFNPAPMTSDVAALPLHRADVLILNEVEAAQLAIGPARADEPGSKTPDKNKTLTEAQLHAELQKRFPDVLIALTLGSRGATILDKGAALHVKAPNVDVVDSTGAGDTFVGYFLAGLINQLTPEQALQRANAAGALAVTIAGATPSIPNQHTVDQFISGE